MAVIDDVRRIAEAASRFAAPGEELAAVLPIEPALGERLYLCAYMDAEGPQSWLALDNDAAPVTSRKRVRDAASIAALVEVAEESADEPPADELRVASASYLDALGATVQGGNVVGALQSALPAVDELTRDIEGNYKLELS
ncbi:hypothetical protein BH18ACT12_BH18ACT12_15630 [soil metagenome]